MGYAAHLRSSATLYARTVNGIRYYFYHKAGLTRDEESHTRVLPCRTDRPPFREWYSFGFMIFAFILIDSAYAVGGWWWWLMETKRAAQCAYVLLIVVALAVISAHVFTYEYLMRRRERLYTLTDNSRT